MKTLTIRQYIYLALLVFILWWVRGALFKVSLLLLVSWALCLLCTPLARALRKRLPRSIAAFLALLLPLGLLAGMISLLVPTLLSQVSQLMRALPSMIRTLSDMGDRLLIRIPLEMRAFVVSRMNEGMESLAGKAIDGAMNAVKMVGSLLYLLPAPIIAWYFLAQSKAFTEDAQQFIPQRYRRVAFLCAREVGHVWQSYLRGQSIVALSVAFMTMVGLYLAGVNSPMVLGCVMALFNLIPYFGPVLGSLPILIVAATQGSIKVLWALGIIIMVQQVDNILIGPKILGKSLGAHPVMVMISVVFGAALFGVLGMVLALPVLQSVNACIRVIRVNSLPNA